VTDKGAGLSAGGIMLYSWGTGVCTGATLTLWPKHSVLHGLQS
jgi:hypothetical protein